MAENNGKQKSGFTLDWLVRGVLTKTGDVVDRLTGRGWKPSSSLATSELIERLKALLDAETQDEGSKGVYVPHNIKLKMQWDKFSTDSDIALKALETELLAAAVDHINDRRYLTHAPLSIEIKTDYFTSGVVLQVSFEQAAEDEKEAALDVTMPGEVVAHEAPRELELTSPSEFLYSASFRTGDQQRRLPLRFTRGTRLSVGRTKGNDLMIDDPSISKIHASLVTNSDGQLIVSDTGSTNGTFVGGQRIAYGKTAVVEAGSQVVFGTVEVRFDRVAFGEGGSGRSETEAGGPEPESSSEQAFMNTQVEFLKAIPVNPDTSETVRKDRVKTEEGQ